MRVLVTGGSGLLGGHVCGALRERGHEVRSMARPGSDLEHLTGAGVERVEGDMLDERSLRRALRGCDGLVHCARRTELWSRNDADAWRVNVDGFAALLRAARATHAERIVHVSSIETLGASRNGELLDESSPWRGPRATRIHDLATRREAEQRAFAAAWAGMPVLVVNIGTLIGPRADGRPGAGPHTLARAGRRWAPPGGSSVVDVSDAARGVALALERGRVGERYALGGHNLSWTELYRAFAPEIPAPFTLPRWAASALSVTTGALDAVRLARPPWTPQVFRSYGWTRFVDSSKAQRELGYELRPLAESVLRARGTAPGPGPS